MIRWLGVVLELPLFHARHRHCPGYAAVRIPDLSGLWCPAHQAGRAANLTAVPVLLDTLGALAGLAWYLTSG